MEILTEYWNHNTAYHPELLRGARQVGGRALDVGCGDGLLVERLAAVCTEVVGIEPDEPTRRVARRRVDQQRTAELATVRIIGGDFLSTPLEPASFDLVTMVASLHHFDLTAGLRRARQVLRPGGVLCVVGLAANRSVRDWLFGLGTLPVVWPISRIRETPYPTVPVKDPIEGLAEIRALAGEILPGALIRRRLFYRYTLLWRRPAQ